MSAKVLSQVCVKAPMSQVRCSKVFVCPKKVNENSIVNYVMNQLVQLPNRQDRRIMLDVYFLWTRNQKNQDVQSLTSALSLSDAFRTLPSQWQGDLACLVLMSSSSANSISSLPLETIRVGHSESQLGVPSFPRFPDFHMWTSQLDRFHIFSYDLYIYMVRCCTHCSAVQERPLA